MLYLFHAVSDSDVVRGARHPRGNPEWPQVGIKPVMRQFLLREPVSQPRWSDELMHHYWQVRK